MLIETVETAVVLPKILVTLDIFSTEEHPKNLMLSWITHVKFMLKKNEENVKKPSI
tara:strand:+ start:370 stop:537 length:168 start_codon:yes stop_codon:yes gene_type:complete